MSDWYRRSEWSEEIEADFEARLARAKPTSRAQYLSLQGYSLIASHPDAGEGLLRRAVDLGDPAELPRAACYLALARLAQNDVDGALAAYDEAVDAERRNPAFRSTAAVDQALLIALFRKSDRYSEALDRLWLAHGVAFGFVDFETAAAEALIRAELGEAEPAKAKARAALSSFPEDTADGAWAGISVAELRQRLEAIA